MRSHRLLLLFAPTFALSNAAWALTVTVDNTASTPTDCAVDAATCSTNKIDQAFQWINATTTSGPHAINIVDASYPWDEQRFDHRLLTTSDATGVTISSDTPTASASTEHVLPPIISEASLTLNHLRMEAGDIWDCAIPADCVGGDEHYVGPVNVYDADLTATDLELRPGPGLNAGFLKAPYHQHWEAGRFVPAIYVREGDVTLTSVDIQNFSPSGIKAAGGPYDDIYYYDGTGVYLDDVWDLNESHDFTMQGPNCNISLGGAQGIASGIHATGSGSVTIDGITAGGCTFTDHSYYGGDAVVFADSADVTVLHSLFQDNYYSAIVMTGGIQVDSWGVLDTWHDLMVEDSTFINNGHWYGGEGCGGAIQVLPPENWEEGYWDSYGFVCLQSADGGEGGGTQNATISNSVFADNDGHWYGGDIHFLDDIGTLEIQGCSFDGGEAPLGGGSVFVKGVGRFGNSSWGAGAEGNTYFSDQGGAIYATGELECLQCAFTDVGAGWGGAVALTADQFGTYARIEDSTFTSTWADMIGGAIDVGMGATLDIETSQFLGTMGYMGGAFGAEGFYPSEGFSTGQRIPVGLVGSEIEARECTFANTSAENGGVFYVRGVGSTARIEDSTFSGSYAGLGEVVNVTAAMPGCEDYGFGGVAVIEPGNHVTIRDSVVTESTADTWGGVLYSGYPWPYYYGFCNQLGNTLRTDLAATGRPNFGAPLPRECGEGEWDGSDQFPWGSEIALDGVTVSDSGAEGAAVAYLGLGDHVTVTGSEFINNLSGTDGTFYGVNVEKLEMTCNTFCNNRVGGRGSVLYVFDDGYDYTQMFDTDSRDIRYTLKNNVLQFNTNKEDGGVIEFEFCEGGSGSYEDTGFGEIMAEAELVAADDSGFDTANPWYSRPRGRFDLWNNTFLENDGSMGLVYGAGGDVRVGIENNVFQDGVSGVNLYDSRYIEGGYNLWYGLDDNTLGDAVPYFPDSVTGVQAQPIYFDYTAQACDSLLILDQDVPSPGVDAGDPLLSDWDGSRSDMGAYGGPGACIPDDDLDGYNAIEDCNDEDYHINPDMPEIPYDGIDQDCDDTDWCDVDADGYDAFIGDCTGNDCNDTDASINPGATDIPYDGIDQDCSGEDECDVDGDGYLSDDTGCGGHDCDDNDNTVYPGAPETPDDSIDQDCDGADAIADVDEDGHDSIEWGGDDCDDGDATIHPGATEIPYDGIDQDCNGEDECDVDNDDQIAEECGGEDCDDEDASIGLGFAETPYDGIDQDCNGEDLCDVDCDGFDAEACEGGTDCDDTDPATYPGAMDNPLDDIDQDCDGEPADLFVTGGCDCDAGGAAPWTGAGLLGMLLAFVRRRRDALPGARNGRE